MASRKGAKPGRDGTGGRTTAFVALLRGVNVGGRNMLPMKSLTALLAERGLVDVRTYIQSGNVVFRAPPALADRLPTLIAGAIREELGVETPAIVRTSAEFARVVAGNPFVKRGLAEPSLHVAFLASSPTAARVRALDPDRSPGDAFVVRGGAVYLHLANGMGRTKLTNDWLDRSLGTVSTVRNWRTVTALLTMCRETP